MTAELRYDGRVALVTGAARGLGAAYAAALATRGAAVVINDLPPCTEGDDPASELVTTIASAGGIAAVDHRDVATPDGARDAVDAAITTFGRLDIVIHNAGLAAAAPFEDLAAATFESLLDVHTRAAFHLLQSAWASLKQQRYGRVVLTSSGAALFGMAGGAAYAMAKLAVLGLANTLAIEGRNHGINVNVVVPIAATRLATALPAELVARLPTGDVADVVAWLVHEDCRASGGIYSVAGRRVVRVVIGLGPGTTVDQPGPEGVQARFIEASDPTVVHVALDPPAVLRHRLPG